MRTTFKENVELLILQEEFNKEAEGVYAMELKIGNILTEACIYSARDYATLEEFRDECIFGKAKDISLLGCYAQAFIKCAKKEKSRTQG